MPIPTQPTETTICTEALRRFLNGGDPETTEVARAVTYGMEKIKRDIMAIGKTWRPLLRTAYDITKVGISHYPNPADFEKDLSVGLMSGDHTGIMRDVVSGSSMSLAIDENAVQIEVEGKLLLITSGTGVDQAEVVDDYSTVTKVCTMATAFSTPPSFGDGYMIVNEIADLLSMSVGRYDQFKYPGRLDTPIRYIPIPNETVGQLALQPVPDAVYGIRRRYYADLLKINTDLDLYDTILRDWANVFEQGILTWKLQEDDDRYETQNQIYQQMLANLLMTDLDGYKPAQQQEGA